MVKDNRSIETGFVEIGRNNARTAAAVVVVRACCVVVRRQ